MAVSSYLVPVTCSSVGTMIASCVSPLLVKGKTNNSVVSSVKRLPCDLQRPICLGWSGGHSITPLGPPNSRSGTEWPSGNPCITLTPAYQDHFGAPPHSSERVFSATRTRLEASGSTTQPGLPPCHSTPIAPSGSGGGSCWLDGSGRSS